MTVYDILITEEYQSQGQKKTAWHKVGSAFDAKSGAGFSGEIIPGVALSGRFVVRPRQERQQQRPPSGRAAQDQPMTEEIHF